MNERMRINARGTFFSFFSKQQWKSTTTKIIIFYVSTSVHCEFVSIWSNCIVLILFWRRERKTTDVNHLANIVRLYKKKANANNWNRFICVYLRRAANIRFAGIVSAGTCRTTFSAPRIRLLLLRRSRFFLFSLNISFCYFLYNYL